MRENRLEVGIRNLLRSGKRFLRRGKQGARVMLSRHPPAKYIPPPVQPDYQTAINNGRLSDAVFTCPIDRCVNLYGFPYGPGGWHPYVALLSRVRDGEDEAYEGSVLERYYAGWQPTNAGEILMGDQPPPGLLVDVPPWAAYPPWMKGAQPAIIAMKIRVLEKENRIGGIHGLPLEVAFSGCGPVADEKGQLEYRRLADVYKSISEIGYERVHGEITGVALHRGPDYRVLVKDGNHRLAALSVLGWQSAPIRLTHLEVVDVDDVDTWPQVQQGIWDRESALRYFDRLFDFDSNSWALERGLM